MKKMIACAFIFMLTANGIASDFIYKDINAPLEQRINDLLQRMTLEEKVLQMDLWMFGKNANPNNNIESKMKEVPPEIGSLIYRPTSPVYRNQIQRKAMEESRLGIPIIFGFDTIHGYRTIFPIPLAQSCSWNTELVKQSCVISAKESWLTGINWTFSPMIDVARDPRWGRVAEAYGEDPYTNAAFCVAAVQGYQGNNLTDKYTIAACLKHYVGYSLSEGGRDYVYSDVSAQTLWETFMPPYEAGIKAGAATVMSGFNDISGVPASANYYTLTEVLKQRWQHDGFVVSDWRSVEYLIDQGVAKDRQDACLKSFTAGVEMDMVSNIYVENLPQLVEEKKVPLSAIDEAVRRILRIKFRLGLFDKPYVDEVEEKDRYLKAEDIAVARQLAAESMVLLKNEKQILPLKSTVKSIAVIGPLAKDSVNMMGSWEGRGIAENVETLFDGLMKEFGGKVALQYEKGCDFDGKNTSDFSKACAVAEQSDVVVVCIGEKKEWSGENASRSSIALPKIQEQLVEELQKVGKPIILVLSSGRPLELIRLNKMADGIIEIWQPGIAGGSALAGILSGRINPSGKLSITFPQTTGQIPVHYNRRKSARPGIGHYQDIPNTPWYPFGHGLSYTNYSYGEIKLSTTQFKKNQQVIAEIEVSNEGRFDGKETVLWFIADPVASISRPLKELKFFEKKKINAGQKKVYKFVIDPMRDLSYVDSTGTRHLETGDYYLEAGNRKVNLKLID